MVTSSPPPSSASSPRIPKETIVLDDTTFTWSDDVAREWLLDTIFTDEEFKNSVRDTITDGGLEIQNPNQFVELITQIFESISGDGGPPPGIKEPKDEWDRYLALGARSRDLFNTDNKPNPDAVYWPDPTRDDSEARSIYETLPVVENLGLVTKDTPIGSAGSCFAIEIAKNLMARDFNYIHTEKAGNPDIGVLVAGIDHDNPTVQYSANWGILFNSPSFAQIAEKAFGVRDFPRIALRTIDSPSFLADPYREAVYFKSVEAYEKDFELHQAAARKALTTCEVFIVTLGLNECWEFTPDGSVISRNPRCGMLVPYLRHRTLTVEENVEAIQRFIDTVRAHNPGLKLIISVSPIPFIATGRAEDCHVVTANGHSKAVLRVAAEELVNRNEGVYYFPSYELVTHCIENPWEPDQRHVNREAVDRVMELFDAMFVTEN